MALELSDLLLRKDYGELPCWNLIREIYQRSGIILPRYSDYITSSLDRNKLIYQIAEEDFVQIKNPEPLCIVAFQSKPKVVNHMGIAIDKHRFIHARKKMGVVIERFDTSLFARWIEGYYKYVGINQIK